MVLTTITRQACRPPASILGLRGDEKQVIDLEWPNSGANQAVYDLLLASLALLHFHRDIDINIAEVIDEFAQTFSPPSSACKHSHLTFIVNNRSKFDYSLITIN